jgi:GAF domain-containing protein/anti-anti-sigma regulatory factor
VPIASGQTIIGVLDLQSDQYDAFDEADVMLMEALADQLAVAIENARLYETVQEELIERRRAEEEAQRRAAQAALLYEVGQRASSTLDLEALLSEIVVAVRDAFDYDGVHLMLLNDQTNRLTLQAMAGSYAGLTPKDLWVAVGEGITGRATATGETQLCGDVSQSPYYVPKAEEKTKAELAVPIRGRENVIGVLDLQSDEYDAFDKTDVMLMETLADQLAVAIENARLYLKVQQELDGRKRMEKALRESQEAFNTVLDSIDADVYVADFDTYEILFMNQHMQDSFGADFTGEICWEVFREGSEPCDHCTNDQLLGTNGEPTEVCVWEGHNPITERWYINYDRAIKWVDGRYVRLQIATDITKVKKAEEALQQSYAEVEKRVEERTAELERESTERERLQRELIEAQQQALRELSTPIIPLVDRIIVMPLIGSIDSMRARDITRSLLAGIQEHRAKVVILDITGVPIVDSGVADHLNKTIQAARLKGARTIITGISDAVAETIVDLGIDWSAIETLSDLQTGLVVALRSLGVEVRRIVADSGT